jgi:hypothetical protein
MAIINAATIRLKYRRACDRGPGACFIDGFEDYSLPKHGIEYSSDSLERDSDARQRA